MRALRRTFIGAATLLLLAALAAWQVPPRLDWSRYRAAIEHFATTTLGRPVSIAGQVRLSLLPRAVLSAGNVTLADRGDGLSARVGGLRLQVAFWPLLRGRVVPLDLVLDDPVVRLPWPLPGAAAALPALAPGFAASTEGAVLTIGGTTISGITASLQSDPDTGAFGANGTALIAGHPTHVTALLGATGNDGVALITLTLDGQGKLAGTGASLRGRLLPGGDLDAVLQARGPDLAEILPAPPLAWQVSGPVRLDGGILRAPQWKLLLGGSPGQLAATLRLVAPAQLDASITLGQLPFGPWLATLAQGQAALKMRLDLQAQAASWQGTTLRDPHLQLDTTQPAPTLSLATSLPGGASLHWAATRPAPSQTQSGSPDWSGPLTLAASDLPASWRALAPAAPGLPPPPSWLPATADLRGTLRLPQGGVAVTDATLKLGTTTITGGVAIARGAHPTLHATLAIDHLSVPAAPGWARAVPELPSARLALADLDLDLDLHVGALNLPGLPARNIALQLNANQAGITLRRLQADVAGLHASANLVRGADGTWGASQLDLAAPDAGLLPANWRIPPGLWTGPFHLQLTGAGPPSAIATVLRADLGDLRAEAEARIDSTQPQLAATVTLRHPGAPRLLQAFGVAGAQSWLDAGSVAMQAHILATQTQLSVPDFTVAAAALRLGGQMAADWSGPIPRISGQIEAANLTLPRFDARSAAGLPFATLAGWQGLLQLHAAQAGWGASQIATDIDSTIALSAGVLAATITRANAAGGTLAADLALDSSQTPPLLALRGSLAAATPQSLPLPFSLTGGTLSLAADLAASGYSPAAYLATLQGTGSASLQGTSLDGIDLPRLQHLLATRAPHARTSLAAALADGATGPLSGTLAATVQSGALRLDAATLAAPAGTLSLSGGLDLPASSADLSVRVAPDVEHAPAMVVRLVGGWGAPRRVVDMRAALLWAGGEGKRRK